MQPLPVCRALVLCEEATEGNRDQWTLRNIYSTFYAPHLPTPPIPFWLYSACVGGEGSYEFVLQIWSLEEDKMIFQTHISQSVSDRLTIFHHFTPLGTYRLTRLGNYEVRYLTLGKQIGITTFDVVKGPNFQDAPPTSGVSSN